MQQSFYLRKMHVAKRLRRTRWHLRSRTIRRRYLHFLDFVTVRHLDYQETQCNVTKVSITRNFVEIWTLLSFTT